jgi:hypothetical protein
MTHQLTNHLTVATSHVLDETFNSNFFLNALRLSSISQVCPINSLTLKEGSQMPRHIISDAHEWMNEISNEQKDHEIDFIEVFVRKQLLKNAWFKRFIVTPDTKDNDIQETISENVQPTETQHQPVHTHQGQQIRTTEYGTSKMRLGKMKKISCCSLL